MFNSTRPDDETALQGGVGGQVGLLGGIIEVSSVSLACQCMHTRPEGAHCTGCEVALRLHMGARQGLRPEA